MIKFISILLLAGTTLAENPVSSYDRKCIHNGITYNVGDSFPSSDSCNTCYCNENGSEVCTEMFCIPKGCHISNEDPKGYCCPDKEECIVEKCLKDGKEYLIGQEIPVEEICSEPCYCETSGIVCLPVAACPEIPKGCSRPENPEFCCQIICEKNLSEVIDVDLNLISESSSNSSSKEKCVQDGKDYAIGQNLPSHVCMPCTCFEDGIGCAIIDCFNLPDGCFYPEDREDCCKYECDNSTTSTTPKPPCDAYDPNCTVSGPDVKPALLVAYEKNFVSDSYGPEEK